MSGRRLPALVGGIALVFAGVLAAAEPAIELRATLAPDPVGRDEMAILTLSVESSGVGLPRVEPGFLLDNLEGAGGPSRSQSTSWVNGRSSSRLELTWRLRPLAVGRARVRELRVEIGPEVRSVANLEITVVEQPPPGRPAPRAGGAPSDPFARLFEDDPFGLFPRRGRDEPLTQPKLALRSLLQPAAAYLGEQVVWTLVLDTQTDISGFRPRSLPEFAGFWTRELAVPQPPRPEWIEIDGEKYGRVAMLARALFPLRDGELTIERIPVEVLARMADADWIGRIRRDQPLELVAPARSLRVLPLPPSPPGFSGIVGRTSIDARLDPPRLNAGQAASLRVSLVTLGNPRGVEPPRLDLPEGLRGFSPETATEEAIVDGHIESRVEWRYVVLADVAGSFEIPPLAWSTFDPVRHEFAVVATPPLPLVVGAAPAVAPLAPTAPTAPSTAPARDTPHGIDWPAGRALLVAGLLALGAGGLFAWRRRAPSAARQLRPALDAARALDSPRDAAKAIDAAWRQLLAERYGLGRGTPLAQWPAALERSGWRAERVAELQQLFEEIHLLEFAPELADADALRADVDRRSRELARRLR